MVSMANKIGMLSMFSTLALGNNEINSEDPLLTLLANLQE